MQRPSLPLQPGHPATHTHDYIRHGTTTLFAGLHVQTGQVTTQTQARHRQREFLAFLDHLAVDTPVHVILDNYATPKTADVHIWLDSHHDWHFHFIPTSSSWMHAVEGLFAKLARGCLQRSNFASLQDLVDTMHPSRTCRPTTASPPVPSAGARILKRLWRPANAGTIS